MLWWFSAKCSWFSEQELPRVQIDILNSSMKRFVDLRGTSLNIANLLFALFAKLCQDQGEVQKLFLCDFSFLCFTFNPQ
jgi:hypothetical protein